MPTATNSAPSTHAAKVRSEDFVGADACQKCHLREYELWKHSTHGQAGGAPGDVKVIAPFDGTPLRFKDAMVIPTVNSAGQHFFVVQSAGTPPLEIPVDAVVGGGHLFGGGTQSFFHRASDGTMRFLPFDFIRRENLWFVQMRSDKTWRPVSEEISLGSDLANWPPHRVLGTATEFSNCQNCHGSQITLQYNETQHRYDTRYQALHINCESCHGPGRRHIEIVSRPGYENQSDIGMQPLATLSKDASVKVCLQCHASKDALRDDPYLPGDDLESFFSLKLAQFGDSPYRVDGRVRTFSYQGNHLYSDCYLNGSMTCVDCHDPHSQHYRDVFGRPLIGKFDNGQCTGCHASKAVAPELHTHHAPDSAGNTCVGCHMPFLQHQGVGSHLIFARSDHTIPIPRPAFDHELGIENACQKCHRDKPIAWHQERATRWYGSFKPHAPMIEHLIKADQTQEAEVASELLLAPEAQHPMAQMAGLGRFIERFLRPNMPALDTGVVAKLETFTRSTDLDLKSLALMALHVARHEDPKARKIVSEHLRRLSGPADPVRTRWAIAADHWANSFASRGDWSNAVVCYQKSLEVLPQNAVTLSHLASAYRQMDAPGEAIQTLRKAIALQPSRAVLQFQLAQAYAQAQRIPAAIAALEEGLTFAPEDGAARQMLRRLRGP